MTAPTVRTLSKSDFILALGCDAKLYFREHRFPDSGGSSPYVQMLRFGGFMVDALARAQRPDGVMCESAWDPVADCARTMAALAQENVTLFQPTFLAGRRMARVDILEKRGSVMRLIEVKMKSFDGAKHTAALAAGNAGVFRNKNGSYADSWDEKFLDLTFQVLVVEQLLPGVTIEPVLVLVDKSKRSSLDDAPRYFDIHARTRAGGESVAYAATFNGSADELARLDVLTEVDASRDVAELRGMVEAEATRFEAMLDASFDRSAVKYGSKCVACEFRVDGPAEKNGFAQCWGEMADVHPHILDLFSIGKVLGDDSVPVVESLPKAGKASLYDIPIARLATKDGKIGPQAERQRRQIAHTRSGEIWVGPELRSRLESVTYPLHFIDFEASRIAHCAAVSRRHEAVRAGGVPMELPHGGRARRRAASYGMAQRG